MRISYSVNEYGASYIAEKMKVLKNGIITARILALVLPAVFITLKSNFFSIPVDTFMITIAISMALFMLFAAVRPAYSRLSTFEKLIKEIVFDGSEVKFILINEKEISGQLDQFYLYEGYKDSVKMKNIFDNELIFSIENNNRGLKNYVITLHFDDWAGLKARFKNAVL